MLFIVNQKFQFNVFVRRLVVMVGWIGCLFVPIQMLGAAQVYLPAVSQPMSVPGYDIIVIGGQSNASNSGVGPRTDSLEGVFDDRIFQLTCGDINGNNIQDPGEPNEVINATDYVRDCFSGYPANANFIKATKRIGFGISFARQYSAHALSRNRKTLIVSGAVPGSGSPAWLDGSQAVPATAVSYLSNLLARVQMALALPGKNRVVAFLWSQGETEIASAGAALKSGNLSQIQYDQYVADYASRVTSIIGKTRSSLGLPNLPVLICGKDPEWTRYENVKLRFADVDRSIAAQAGHSIVVETTGLYSNPLCTGDLKGTFDCEDADYVHFSAQSHVDLGYRFFERFRYLLLQP